MHGMIPQRPVLLRRSFAWSLVLALVVLAIVAAWAYGKTPDLRRGAALYSQHCASCQGARLEGQPDWQIAGADGVLPAPPHDETGHTWHHDDAMLTDYTRRGGQAVLDDMGVAMTSGMPGFGAVLPDEDIAAILAFIKSQWPARIKAIQAERSGG